MATPQGYKEERHKTSFWIIFWANWGFAFILTFGLIRDYIECLVNGYLATEKGYAPLSDNFASVYSKHIYGRVCDVFDRPLVSGPDAWIDVNLRNGSPIDRKLRISTESKRCLNLGSYNYLGFGGYDSQKAIIDQDIKTLKHYSVCSSSTRIRNGTNPLHRELEKQISQFLHRDDAIVFGMGFATNSTVIPALVSKGDLIISDRLNHASIAVGCMPAGAAIRVFKHNDMKDLEKILKKAIFEGNPKTGKPWGKIVIIVEGLYSMEGEVVSLPEVIALKKKYKAYLYVDEAHSIGALGKTGRGVCDYWGVDHRDVDVLMGTFTKSFASCGGYIAADQKVVDWVRSSSYSTYYDSSIPAVSVQQIISTLRIVSGDDNSTIGKSKISLLKRNSIFFRQKLKDAGMMVLGDYDSPVIPVFLYIPSNKGAFARLATDLNLAVVVVGYPATELIGARVRFCMSSSHSLADLEDAAKKVSRIAEIVKIDFLKKNPKKHPEYIAMFESGKRSDFSESEEGRLASCGVVSERAIE